MVKSKRSVFFSALLAIGSVALACEYVHGGEFGLPVAPVGELGFDSYSDAMAAASQQYPQFGDGRDYSIEFRVPLQACLLGVCGNTSVPVNKPCDETFEDTGSRLDNELAGVGAGGGGGWYGGTGGGVGGSGPWAGCVVGCTPERYGEVGEPIPLPGGTSGQ